MHRFGPSLLRMLAFTSIASALPGFVSAQSGTTITGQAAFTDYTQEHPGVRRKITLAALPAPNPDESVDNGPIYGPGADGELPFAPKGRKADLDAEPVA